MLSKKKKLLYKLIDCIQMVKPESLVSEAHSEYTETSEPYSTIHGKGSSTKGSLDTQNYKKSVKSSSKQSKQRSRFVIQSAIFIRDLLKKFQSMGL